MNSAKRNRVGKDPDYLAWVHEFPCIVCAWGYLQRRGVDPLESLGVIWWRAVMAERYGPVEAAHVGDRGLGQKCPDREAIPLCAAHHRTGPQAIHKLGRGFWEHHGLDRGTIIAQLVRIYELERGTGGIPAESRAQY